MEYSIKPKRFGRKENNPLPSKEDNRIICNGMRKIGILTQYHNTINYGGALQAYALCKVINNMGYECEQVDICFDKAKDIYSENNKKKKRMQGLRNQLTNLYKNIKRLIHHKQFKELKELRNKLRSAFYEFNVIQIPHSSQEYNESNISDAVSKYDAFIVGSDQVWNPIWYFEPFFLSFVPLGIPKIAYAVSVAQDVFPENVKTIYREHMKDFKAISVREKDAVELIDEISSVKVEHVLDPTLLLSKEEWNEVAEDRIIDKPYVFCYFLGNSEHMRDRVNEFATKHGYIIVNAMHAAGIYHKSDVGFGDEKLDVLAPKDFLSLIKYSEYIFTDSFHATVFSLIFQKEFFVFERQGFKTMGKRISGLLSLFQLENRFCNESGRDSFEYINNQGAIDYTKTYTEFQTLKEKSMAFLSTNLL